MPIAADLDVKPLLNKLNLMKDVISANLIKEKKASPNHHELKKIMDFISFELGRYAANREIFHHLAAILDTTFNRPITRVIDNTFSIKLMPNTYQNVMI